MFNQKEYLKEYYLKNRETIIQRVKENKHKYKDNKEKRRERQKRYSKDPLRKIINKKRMSIKMALKRGGYNKTSIPCGLLGCGYVFYLEYLENKFKKGMTWDNYGKWHIDHITPLSSAKDEVSLNKLFNYRNTQPLWAHDNRVKGVN